MNRAAATFLLSGATLFAPSLASAGSPHDVFGVWLVESKDAKIKVTDCGDGSPCGTMIWVDAPEGEMPVDDKNPDESLRSRPMIGIKMIYGFSRKSKGWKKGKIYNPSDGKTYKSTINLQDDGRLQVKGCVGPFCQSQYWTKAEAKTP